MSVFQAILVAEPVAGIPDSTSDHHSRRMSVTVVKTTPEGTLAALNTAASLAGNLGAEIVLLVAEEVYYRYSLHTPPVSPNFLLAVCLALVERSNLRKNGGVSIQICFCRKQLSCLEDGLKPRSLVIIGKKPGWLRRRERKLGRALELLGHEVLLVDSESVNCRADVRAVMNRAGEILTGEIAA